MAAQEAHTRRPLRPPQMKPQRLGGAPRAQSWCPSSSSLTMLPHPGKGGVSNGHELEFSHYQDPSRHCLLHTKLLGGLAGGGEGTGHLRQVWPKSLMDEVSQTRACGPRRPMEAGRRLAKEPEAEKKENTLGTASRRGRWGSGTNDLWVEDLTQPSGARPPPPRAATNTGPFVSAS